MENSSKNYRVGIDVGVRSIGFAAIEVDDGGMPLSALNQSVLIHDGALDPDGHKEGITRVNASGVARRTRRLRRRRRERLAALDRTLEDLGWPIVPVDGATDEEFLPWKARGRLASEFIDDPEERHRLLSIAVRHMARHRGWRSPWVRTESLMTPVEDSEAMVELRNRFDEAVGRTLPADLTIGQLVCCLKLSAQVNLRRRGTSKNPKQPIFDRVMQSDNVNELRRIAEVQQLPDDVLRTLILSVFQATSPRGAAAARAGFDPLAGDKKLHRASAADPFFQRYRIIAQVANLRLRNPDTGEDDRLPVDLKQRAVEFLLNATKRPTWNDVAEHLGVERPVLRGTATLDVAGERLAAQPLVDATNIAMSSCKVKAIREWWASATIDQRSLLIHSLNSEDVSGDEVEWADVDALLSSLEDQDFEKLDALTLPSGRAAYSVDTLRRLSQCMLTTDADLHQARKQIFDVDDNWRPPADPIGAAVGNPAVDRVMKAVNRWLMMAEHRWGAPQSISIEHVRQGFSSVKVAREIDRENNKRAAQRESVRQVLKSEYDIESASTQAIRRYEAVQRQNGECLYCGCAITLQTCEMDHIVPRKGPGSTNTRDNLVAVCETCNRAKSNTLFSDWATRSPREGVSVADAIKRVRFFLRDPGMSATDFRRLQQGYIRRLKQTHADPPIDNRSIESVAWMARELADRIRYHYRDEEVPVRVYRCTITSEARKASGFAKRITLFGGAGKTRLDRRHHAVDATVIALMRPKVAEVLSQRHSMMIDQRETDGAHLSADFVPWREFTGADFAARTIFGQWIEAMERLAEITQDNIDHDRIPVHQNLRLRIGSGRAHADTVSKLAHKRLSDEWTLAEVDRASSPALWCALTRCEDFTWPKREKDVCLPENPERRITVNGVEFRGDDEVELFPTGAASLAVRGGAVAVGGTLHHVRFYRVPGKRAPSYLMLRVFGVDFRHLHKADVFTAELPEQSVSMRQAGFALRCALREGTAEYLGWAVAGDEIVVDPPHAIALKDHPDANAVPSVSRWVVTGAESGLLLNMKPRMLAEEGINDKTVDQSYIAAIDKKCFAGNGWRATVNKLLSQHSITIIRRDAHGRPRWRSSAHLPVSVRLVEH